MKKKYTEYTELYRRKNGYFDPLVKRLSLFIETNKPAILDVGCGFGDFLASLKKFYPKATCFGLTFSTNEYKQIKKTKPFISILHGNQIFLSRLFRNNKFDLIVNFHTLSYVDQKDQLNVIKKMTKLIKKDGLLFLGTIDSWVKNTKSIKQSGQGYVQYYYSPKIFFYLANNYRLLLSYKEKRNNYRLHVWKKQTNANYIPIREFCLAASYVVKSIFLR